MAQRLTIDDIRKGFSAKGWNLLTTEYLNNQQKLDVICNNGHTTTITWCNFKNGQGCRFCGTFKRYTYEEVKNTFEKHGCKLISEEYVHNNKPLDYICSCGNVSKIAFSHLLTGGRCRECGNKKTAEKLRTSNDSIESFCKEHQCILIELIHETNNHTKIKYICKCGRENEAFLSNFKRFPNCWECNKNKKTSDKCYLLNLNRVKTNKIISVKDIKEHIIPNISDIQNDLDTFLKTINADKIHVKIINPFNYRNRQSLRSELINIKEKTPVFILPYEWMNRQSQCKNRLLAISGTFNKRLYARKCKIEKISIKTHAQFCRNYHIQGNNTLTISAWGLFFNNELLGSISLGRHHRNYTDILLLDRLCFAPDIQVIGGANRLFNQCKEWAEEKGIKQIVSFSDNRWSLGNVYENLEFKLDKELDPDYYYVKDGDPFTLLSKQSQKKSNTNCPEEFTELEWATQHGLVRSYDCGKKRWVYNLGD